ncbi:MAG: hypothetical protein WC791_03820 [Candidatus Paceibacterota bacterium]|jgi:hypothetical protein
MRHPNCYLIDGKDAVASAQCNLKKLLDGFEERKVMRLPAFNAKKYKYWQNAERFWYWFKQLHRGGWKLEEGELRDAALEVTLRHYPKMKTFEIENEIRLVLSMFLFDRESISEEEKEKLARFHLYLSSLHVALG